MWPESGLIRPRHSLRIVLLPEPATPSTTLVSPRLSSKETPSSTVKSSNARCTSSKMMVLWTVSLISSGESMDSSSQKEEELGQDGVRSQDENRRGDHRLCGRAAHALRSSARAESVIAAY